MAGHPPTHAALLAPPSLPHPHRSAMGDEWPGHVERHWGRRALRDAAALPETCVRFGSVSRQQHRWGLCSLCLSWTLTPASSSGLPGPSPRMPPLLTHAQCRSPRLPQVLQRAGHARRAGQDRQGAGEGQQAHPVRHRRSQLGGALVSHRLQPVPLRRAHLCGRCEPGDVDLLGELRQGPRPPQRRGVGQRQHRRHALAWHAALRRGVHRAAALPAARARGPHQGQARGPGFLW